MKRLIHSLLGSAVILAALWLNSFPAHAQFTYVPLLNNGPLSLCRLGINGSLVERDPQGTTKQYPIKPLRLGWYLNYSTGARSVGSVRYFPMIRLEQTPTGYNYSFSSDHDPVATESDLRTEVSKRPGSYWIIGNEPDRITFQDNLEPHVYAQAYHDLYHIIKETDPTAKIVAGTIVQPTPIRLQYLDLVLASYSQSFGQAMPVDAWAFHNFILNEADCNYWATIEKNPDNLRNWYCWGAEIPPGVDATLGLHLKLPDDIMKTGDIELFKSQVIAFRQWMADRGYRNTPAFLSEFGILFPYPDYKEFPPEKVNAFMNATFDFLLNATDPEIGYQADNNRLVQRFAWYSVSDKVAHNGNLFDPELPVQSSLTAMGANFAQYSKPIAESVDFYPVDLKLLNTPPSGQGAATLNLEAVIANSGNLAAGTVADVRFFNGDPNNGGELIGSDQTVSLPGCGMTQAVQIQWSSVPPGNYTVYVQVRTNQRDIDETNNLRNLVISVN